MRNKSEQMSLFDTYKGVAASMEEDKPKLRRCIQTLEEEGDSVSIEYRVRHRNGDILHVMGNIKLLRENGELIYQRFLLDCTEQKRQEKRNERRQMELIQALTLDYNLICCFDPETGMGSQLREGDDNGIGFLPLFEGEISLEESMRRYIDSYVYEEDKELMREASSLEVLRKELGEHFRDTTTINIAQRISSIQGADHILVLEDGRCIGYGTHGELLRSCPAYQMIYELQMGQQEEEERMTPGQADREQTADLRTAVVLHRGNRKEVAPGHEG